MTKLFIHLLDVSAFSNTILKCERVHSEFTLYLILMDETDNNNIDIQHGLPQIKKTHKNQTGRRFHLLQRRVIGHLVSSQTCIGSKRLAHGPLAVLVSFATMTARELRVG